MEVRRRGGDGGEVEYAGIGDGGALGVAGCRVLEDKVVCVLRC